MSQEGNSRNREKNGKTERINSERKKESMEKEKRKEITIWPWEKQTP